MEAKSRKKYKNTNKYTCPACGKGPMAYNTLWSHCRVKHGETPGKMFGTGGGDLPGSKRKPAKRKYTKRAGRGKPNVVAMNQIMSEAMAEGRGQIIAEAQLTPDVTIYIPVILGTPYFSTKGTR